MTVRKNLGQRKRVPSTVTLPADLEAELDKVRKAAPPPPSDDPIYKYLKRVYSLQREIASSSEWRQAIQKYHAAHVPRTLKNYPSVIIQLTVGNHNTSNMKYKYVTALEYAFANRVQPENLKAFIKKQGGLNKCVDLWNKQHGEKPRRKPRKKKV